MKMIKGYNIPAPGAADGEYGGFASYGERDSVPGPYWGIADPIPALNGFGDYGEGAPAPKAIPTTLTPFLLAALGAFLGNKAKGTAGAFVGAIVGFIAAKKAGVGDVAPGAPPTEGVTSVSGFAGYGAVMNDNAVNQAQRNAIRDPHWRTAKKKKLGYLAYAGFGDFGAALTCPTGGTSCPVWQDLMAKLKAVEEAIRLGTQVMNANRSGYYTKAELLALRDSLAAQAQAEADKMNATLTNEFNSTIVPPPAPLAVAPRLPTTWVRPTFVAATTSKLPSHVASELAKIDAALAVKRAQVPATDKEEQLLNAEITALVAARNALLAQYAVKVAVAVQTLGTSGASPGTSGTTGSTSGTGGTAGSTGGADPYVQAFPPPAGTGGPGPGPSGTGGGSAAPPPPVASVGDAERERKRAEQAERDAWQARETARLAQQQAELAAAELARQQAQAEAEKQAEIDRARSQAEKDRLQAELDRLKAESLVKPAGGSLPVIGGGLLLLWKIFG
jgi:hypothetical protein